MLSRALLTATLILGFSFSAQAQDRTFDVGVGVGLPYTGVGASGRYYLNDTSALQISYGCVGWSNTISNLCGMGASYEFTGFHPNDVDNRHAIGLYAGLAGSKLLVNYEANERYFRSVYGAGTYYNFYRNGFGNRGFHIGASTWIANETYHNKRALKLAIHLGYRF
ncbi:MAG: hypothetical protein LAT53_11390 [Idiomarina sp.]|nr:hypothetical protein [Idiomarina sp.]